MTHDKIDWLFKNDITIRLVRADHAPLILSFIHQSFKQENRISYTEKDLESVLGDYLHALNKEEVLYPLSAKQYLLKWTEQGFLRRHYEEGDEPIFDLTPAAENALKLMEDLNKQEFVGTESRLLHFFSILKELALKTNSNVYERIKDLEDQKKTIDAEILKANQGSIEIFDDTKIKERFLYAEETAKRLLADFRQVEQNFRDLDRGVREKIIKSNVSKGLLLDDIFEEQDYVWTTDQGKSFRAFWEFLMSRQKQEELESLISVIMEVPQIMKIREEASIHRIKNNLIEAGDKVNRTNDGLIEQLRKFVEQKSLSESRRILHSIEEIEKLLLDHKEDKDILEVDFEIDGIAKGNFFMNRLLFTPPQHIKFETITAELGISDSSDEILFNQFNIDHEELKENISQLLKHQNQVTLKEIAEKIGITKGIAEIVAYYHIASRENKHFINPDFDEQLIIENSKTSKSFSIKLPQIIFNR
jgi:hypothetical protein